MTSSAPHIPFASRKILLASQLLGFAKLWFMAAVLGCSAIGSALCVALMAPAVFSPLVISALLAVSVLPVHVEASVESARRKPLLPYRSFLLLSFALLAVSASIAAAAAPLSQALLALCPSSGSVQPLLETALRITAPQIFLVGTCALSAGFLQCANDYNRVACGFMIRDALCIAALIAFYLLHPIMQGRAFIPLVCCFTLGSAIPLLLQLPSIAAWRRIHREQSAGRAKQPALDARIAPFVLVSLGLLASTAGRVIFGIQAGPKAPIPLYYAGSLVLWGFSLTFSILKPAFFENLHQGMLLRDRDHVGNQVHAAALSLLSFSIPLALVCWASGSSLTHLLAFGSMPSTSTQSISQLLSFWILALPSFSLCMLFASTLTLSGKGSGFAALFLVVSFGQVGAYALFADPLNLNAEGIGFVDAFAYTLLAIAGSMFVRAKVAPLRAGRLLGLSTALLLASAACMVIAIVVNLTSMVYKGPVFDLIRLAAGAGLALVASYQCAKLLRFGNDWARVKNPPLPVYQEPNEPESARDESQLGRQSTQPLPRISEASAVAESDGAHVTAPIKLGRHGRRKTKENSKPASSGPKHGRHAAPHSARVEQAAHVPRASQPSQSPRAPRASQTPQGRHGRHGRQDAISAPTRTRTTSEGTRSPRHAAPASSSLPTPRKVAPRRGKHARP